MVLVGIGVGPLSRGVHMTLTKCLFLCSRWCWLGWEQTSSLPAILGTG